MIDEKKVAGELVKVAKDLVAEKTNSRFSLMLSRGDFKNQGVWRGILEDMGVVVDKETNWDEPEDIELKIVGGRIF